MVTLTHKGVTYGAPYDERPEYGMVFRKVFLATGGRPPKFVCIRFFEE